MKCPFVCLLCSVLLFSASNSVAQGTDQAKSVPLIAAKEPVAQLAYLDLLRLAGNGGAQPAGGKEDATSHRMLISSNTGVDVGSIQLHFATRQGPVQVPIDGQGFFVIPENEVWKQENPFLVSNQPKGSLQIRVMVPLPEPAPEDVPKVVDGKIKYRALFETVLKMTRTLRGVDPKIGAPGSSEFAVELVVGDHPVKILRGLGARTLPAWKGSVWMVFDPVLHQEDPEIEVPPNAEVRLRLVPAEVAKKIRDRF